MVYVDEEFISLTSVLLTFTSFGRILSMLPQSQIHFRIHQSHTVFSIVALILQHSKRCSHYVLERAKAHRE